MTAYRRDLGGHQTHDPTATARFVAVQKKNRTNDRVSWSNEMFWNSDTFTKDWCICYWYFPFISVQERTVCGDVTYILFVEDACDVEEVLVLQSWKWLLYMKVLRKHLCHWKFISAVTYKDKNARFVSGLVRYTFAWSWNWLVAACAVLTLEELEKSLF